MNEMGFYLAAVVMMGLGAFLVMNTSPYSRMGGAKYERRRRRRDFGVLLMILATIVLGVGLISHFAASHL
jgi:hypothetical protein